MADPGNQNGDESNSFGPNSNGPNTGDESDHAVPNHPLGNSADETIGQDLRENVGRESDDEIIEGAAILDAEAGSTVLEPTAVGAVAPIRYGSPFAIDPIFVASEKRAVELFLDVGPMKYTAMGAVAASAMVIIFASFAAWWFPIGGTFIAGLGCVLAIFGLFSHYRYRALACLVTHLVLFMVCYGRALLV